LIEARPWQETTGATRHRGPPRPLENSHAWERTFVVFFFWNFCVLFVYSSYFRAKKL
jgi:hypothetical protein